MAAVSTVSTRVPVDDLARQVRAGVEQDGRAVLAAASGNPRQGAHLRRLTRLLATSGDLDYLEARTSGGTTYLMVRPAGNDGPITWRGDPKTG
jgi:hypothetical protein